MTMMTMLLDASWLQRLIDWDTQLMLWINGFHNEFMDDFMWGYTKVLVWVPLYLALVYILTRNLSAKNTLLVLLGVALTILLCDQICSHVIRPEVQRLRPANLNNPISSLVHIVNGYRGGRFSFPSAHASNTFGLAFFLTFLFRRPLLSVVMFVWAFLNCYSRIYLGVHYPGDIFVGMMLGLVVATCCYLLLRRWIGNDLASPYLRYSTLPPIVWIVSVCALVGWAIVY